MLSWVGTVKSSLQKTKLPKCPWDCPELGAWSLWLQRVELAFTGDTPTASKMEGAFPSGAKG